MNAAPLALSEYQTGAWELECEAEFGNENKDAKIRVLQAFL